MRKQNGIGLCLLILVMSCSAFGLSYSELVYPAQEVISEDATSRSVGRLFLKVDEYGGSGIKIPICTLSLVGKSRQAGLTAAHCFNVIQELFGLDAFALETQKILKNEGIRFVAVFGNRSVEVSEFLIQPDYQTNNQADLALLRFKKPIRGIQPVVLPNKSRLYSGAMNLRMYGYNFPGISGKKSFLASYLLDPSLFRTPKKWNMSDFNLESQKYDQQILFFTGEGRHPCKGSSGGPVFVQDSGKWVQVTIITASSWLTCATSTNQKWQDAVDAEDIGKGKTPISLSGGAFLAAYMDWIDRSLAEFDKGKPESPSQWLPGKHIQ